MPSAKRPSSSAARWVPGIKPGMTAENGGRAITHPLASFPRRREPRQASKFEAPGLEAPAIRRIIKADAAGSMNGAPVRQALSTCLIPARRRRLLTLRIFAVYELRAQFGGTASRVAARCLVWVLEHDHFRMESHRRSIWSVNHALNCGFRVRFTPHMEAVLLPCERNAL